MVFLILWSSNLISPQKWLRKAFREEKKTLKHLRHEIRHLDSKTSRIDKNVQIMRGELGKILNYM